MAETLAMAAVCSSPGEKPCMACKHCEKASRRIHPDITAVDKLPDKRMIVVEQIRELKKDVIVVPNESERKAYVVNDAELMNRAAQNAFLQILEEPPAHAVFILKTGNPAELLPTVRSRCVELKARPEAGTPGAAAEEMARGFVTALRGSNADLIAFMFRLEKLDKEHFAEFLAHARELAAAEVFADSQGGAGTHRDDFARAERLLTRAGGFLDLNVNVGHIAGMICANLIS